MQTMPIRHYIGNLLICGIITRLQQTVNIVIDIVHIASLMIEQERNLTSTIDQLKIWAVVATEWINRNFLSTLIGINLILVLDSRGLQGRNEAQSIS